LKSATLLRSLTEMKKHVKITRRFIFLVESTAQEPEILHNI
jgi:hypothetical protein